MLGQGGQVDAQCPGHVCDGALLSQCPRQRSSDASTLTPATWAKLRILVRHTLQRWKYPPDQQADAVELVLKQAETLSNEWSK